MKGSRKVLKKFPVSHAALMARVNRKLAVRGQTVKVTRGDRGRKVLGDYYIVDDHRTAIVATHRDLETLARELGVLKPWEEAEV